ncbi:MAG TPA: hypothetical protein PLK99_00460 [Burkholderiales bacterium]|nr:hypothetical protein [Burkholderiales bacterium]
MVRWKRSTVKIAKQGDGGSYAEYDCGGLGDVAGIFQHDLVVVSVDAAQAGQSPLKALGLGEGGDDVQVFVCKE